jgi:hypothetical protein
MITLSSLMIKRLKPPKNRLKIDFNLDLVVMYSEKVGTFDDIHLFLFQDIVLFCFNRNTHFSCKKGQTDFHTSTLPHKNMSQLLHMSEKITTFAG